MIKAIIIEDEKPAAINLMRKIAQVDNTMVIEATLSTIEESIQWPAVIDPHARCCAGP